MSGRQSYVQLTLDILQNGKILKLLKYKPFSHGNPVSPIKGDKKFYQKITLEFRTVTVLQLLQVTSTYKEVSGVEYISGQFTRLRNFEILTKSSTVSRSWNILDNIGRRTRAATKIKIK